MSRSSGRRPVVVVRTGVDSKAITVAVVVTADFCNTSFWCAAIIVGGGVQNTRPVGTATRVALMLKVPSAVGVIRTGHRRLSVIKGASAIGEADARHWRL